MKKIKIRILDDEADSAAHRASCFLNYTTASMLGNNGAEVLQRLPTTRNADGVEIEILQPSELFNLRTTDLEHGIALVDINWWKANLSDPHLSNLSPLELETYGLRIVDWLRENRPAESHFHIILYSATKGDYVAEYFSEWAHEPYFHMVVGGEGTRAQPLLQKLAWKAYEEICHDLLQQADSAVADSVIEATQAWLNAERLLRIHDLTGKSTDCRIAGYRLVDLAQPYFLRYADALSRIGSAEECADEARSIVDSWRSHFDQHALAFEFEEANPNLSVCFIKSLLRYGSIDAIDALLWFRDCSSSKHRFFDPVTELRKRLQGPAKDPKQCTLRHALDRIPRIQLGTQMDKDPTKPAGIPSLLRDRSVLEVERIRSEEKAVPPLFIKALGDFRFTLEVDPKVRLLNKLWHTARLCEHALQQAIAPADLLEAFQDDPDNLNLLNILAEEADTLLENITSDTRPILVDLAQHLSDWIDRIDGAQTAVEALRLFIAKAKLDKKDREILLLDLEGCSDKLQTWQHLRTTLAEGFSKLKGLGFHAVSVNNHLEQLKLMDNGPQRTAYFREHLKPLAIKAQRTATSALKKQFKDNQNKSNLLEKALQKRFPTGNEALHLENLLAFFLQALDSSGWQHGKSLGGNLPEVLRKSMSTFIIQDLSKEIPSTHSNDLPEHTVAPQAVDRGADLTQQVTRWLQPIAPDYSMEVLFDALAEINESAGSDSGYGLEECFFPDGLVPGHKPAMSRQKLHTFLQALKEVGIHIAPAILAKHVSVRRAE